MAIAFRGPWTSGLQPEEDDDVILKGREFKDLARRLRQLEEEVARSREPERKFDSNRAAGTADRLR